MLDAARDLLLERGSGNATVEAIADVSGAPTGSIYTGSGRDGLLTRLLRTGSRSSPGVAVKGGCGEW
jgi:hypothetical protein